MYGFPLQMAIHYNCEKSKKLKVYSDYLDMNKRVVSALNPCMLWAVNNKLKLDK